MAATAAARRATAERAAPARARARRAPARPPQRSSRTRAATARRRGVTPVAGLQIPVAVGQRTAVAVGGLADSGLVHRLTRGRLWILLLAALLAGIVALNVLSLSLSASASRVASQADEVARENSVLRTRLTNGVSSQQVQAAGERAGLLMPAPGAIDYLRPGEGDAEVAAERLRNGELSVVPPVEAAPTEPSLEPTEMPVGEAPVPADPVAPAETTVPVEPVAPVEPAVEPTAPAPVTEPGAIAAP